MVTTSLRHLALAFLFFAPAVLVAACGGGGDGKAAPTVRTAPASASPTVFSTIIPGAVDTPGPPPPPSGSPAPGTATYTVVDGDNPTVIARKLNVPDANRDAWVQQFLSLNGVTAGTLRAGQVLKLPPPDTGAPATTRPPLGEAVGTPPPNLLPPGLTGSTPAAKATPALVAPGSASPCDSFSTQKARDWCSRPFAAPRVTCEDFAKGTGEATRFTKSFDPLDVNGLDPDHNGKSCDDK